MIFSSFIFIFYFLPLVLALYALTPKKFKNLSLALSSIFFYSWGEPVFVLIFFGFCVFNFVVGLWIEASLKDELLQTESRKLSAKSILTLGIFINVAALVYFKYSNFFLADYNRVLSLFGSTPLVWQKVILPIGISFTTFQSISYLVDVYRRRSPAERKIVDYMLYAFFFPHLIAGPIVRYVELRPELKQRSTKLNDLYEGLFRFSIGLAKKVLLADVIGHTADQIFSVPPNTLTQSQAWIGMIAYTAQLYFDFSGYSDMAIGLARMFGFRFPENFDRPYLANSFSDFWRRWHMSFGRWMRDYLYYPLGGNRCSPARGYFNLWIVFLFSGFWHGAQWTFVLWGAYHGLFMTLEKLFLDRLTQRVPNTIKVLFTLFLVMLSRVIFRAENLAFAGAYYKQMFAPVISPTPRLWGYLSSPYEIAMLLLGYAICLYPLVPGLNSLEHRVKAFFNQSLILRDSLHSAVCITLLALSAIALAGRDFSPFIYFQF